VVSVQQPVVRPLGNARPALESVAGWSGKPAAAYDLLRRYWQAAIFPRQKMYKNFNDFWDRTVHDGCAQIQPDKPAIKPFNGAALRPIRRADPLPEDSYALVLYPKPGMLEGRHAYNPVLQEMPDPITKVAWDNYACLSPAAAARLGVSQGGTVILDSAGPAMERLVLPVFVQPGQHDQAVAVALGYGSRLSARFAEIGPKWIEARPSVGSNGLVGQNGAAWLRLEDGTLQYSRPVKLSRGYLRHELASTQEHHTLSEPAFKIGGGQHRSLVRETVPGVPAAHEDHAHQHADLWPADHAYTGHRWGAAIDLNACTGCSACVVACQLENNVPVVGKDEVRRNRAMHWLRVDRYYAEHPGGGVDAAYLPMICQQCENAPCETVCPVLATIHSSEGLNLQVYNRCVGTRYCANNCPYKGRRFNWFDYKRDDALLNLALNPDVTVRTRGVMEKCSFCIQRIQEAKIAARAESRPISDGEIQTACQQTCPAGAIVFGDLNDPNSRVSKLAGQARGYRLLEELNVRPSVTYLAVVRNREEETQEHHG
jgi:molybdopterin-containing oxidoreductase family iron-sulfur binding subunit